jgi:hypothetical protein
MVEVAEANPSVGIVGAYRLDEDRVNLDGLPYPSTVVPGREICRWSLLGGPYIFGSPTSLLIRSDLIRTRKKFYNESNIHADLEACFDILQSADFGFVHHVLTFTRRHNETLTTFSRRFNTYLIANFIVLKKYGPIYLNREEYEKRLKLKIRNYHRFLARSIFEQREKDFWDYHKRALNNLGHPVSMTELTKAFFPEVLKYTVRKIKQAIEKKQE